jgi:uncharacterized membrane protein
MRDTLYVLAASYDDVDDALRDYQAKEVAWRHVSSSHDFDPTVVGKDETGNVQIVRRHDEPTRHGSATGLAWGLAAGAVAALFPVVGILGALAAGGGAGAALGAVAGHASGALSRDDLKALGEVLDQGAAGLVVVYPTEMADRVATSVSAASAKVHATAGITGEQLAADVRAAEERRSGVDRRRLTGVTRRTPHFGSAARTGQGSRSRAPRSPKAGRRT